MKPDSLFVVPRRADLEVRSVLPQRPAGGGPPLLFVHGLGHGAWCWGPWMHRAAAAGRASYAVSLRGHAGSAGSVRRARLSDYVDDVVAAVDALEEPPVLVGHSMGGLVVQMVMARRAVPAGVLVASIGPTPAIGSFLAVLRAHPGDALAMSLGRTLPMRADYLFERLGPGEAGHWAAQCGPESPWAQLQLLFHRAPEQPINRAPVLVLAARRDRLVPITDLRRTAAYYGADLHEFDRMGHNLMLDTGWEQPVSVLLDWVARLRPVALGLPQHRGEARGRAPVAQRQVGVGRRADDLRHP